MQFRNKKSFMIFFFEKQTKISHSSNFAAEYECPHCPSLNLSLIRVSVNFRPSESGIGSFLVFLDLLETSLIGNALIVENENNNRTENHHLRQAFWKKVVALGSYSIGKWTNLETRWKTSSKEKDHAVLLSSWWWNSNYFKYASLLLL